MFDKRSGSGAVQRTARSAIRAGRSVGKRSARPGAPPSPGGRIRRLREGAAMSRRHADVVEVRRRDDVPEQFLWRSRLYQVRKVLGHWVESGAWWRSARSSAMIDGSEPAAGTPLPSPEDLVLGP